jgi:hypothetical protein
MSVLDKLAAVLVGAACVVGCSSTVTTVTSYDVLFTSGVPSEFSYAASGGEMPVVVIGNPFGRPQEDVEAALISAMQGQNYGARVTFVPAEGEARYTGYRVVMLLNSGGVRGDAACRLRPGPSGEEIGEEPAMATQPATSTGRTTLLGAFCGNANARSWAYSTTGPLSSPKDSQFRELVSRATFAMLPPRDDDFGDSGDYD